MPFFEADRSPIAAGGTNGLRYPPTRRRPSKTNPRASCGFAIPRAYLPQRGCAVSRDSQRWWWWGCLAKWRRPRSSGSGLIALRGVLRAPRCRCCGLAARSHTNPSSRAAHLAPTVRLWYQNESAGHPAQRRAGTEQRCATPCDACGGRRLRKLHNFDAGPYPSQRCKTPVSGIL